MSTVPNKKLSAYLFLVAGGIFFVAAIVGAIIARQPAFYGFFGIGAAFVVIAIALLHRAKRR
jgi:bacteriorhodopsin